MMPQKQSYTARDRLAAHLVLLIIVAMFVTGALVLYMTGIFAPVQGTVELADIEPLALPSPPVHAARNENALLALLFPTASAEENMGEEIIAIGQQTDADLGQGNAVEQLLTQIIEEEKESDITANDRVQIDKKDLAVNPNLPEEWFNVLLLGTDTRDIMTSNGRTDVMIIASINAATGEVKLSSIARDAYVPIPNIDASNRINAAFAFGGAPLAMKTVNQNFHMNIENYILVNFSVMASIVDSIGGVDIYIAEENPGKVQEYEVLNELVAVAEDYEGFAKSTTRRPLTLQDMGQTVHLDGLQAVAYARIRTIDNDLQRGSRQRILLQSLMEKVMNDASITSIIGLFNNISRAAETNLVVSKIMELGSKILLAGDLTITEKAIPVPGSYRGSTEIDAKGKEINVLRVDMDKNVQELHEFIYGEYIAPPEV